MAEKNGEKENKSNGVKVPKPTEQVEKKEVALKAEAKPAPAVVTTPTAATVSTQVPAPAAKPTKKKGLERVYTIPLRKAFEAKRTSRANRAVDIIRAFAARHMKSPLVRIDEKVNQLVWSHGIEKIPRKVTVRLEKIDDVTTVSLPE